MERFFKPCLKSWHNKLFHKVRKTQHHNPEFGPKCATFGAKLSFILFWPVLLFPERLHWCHIYFHCSHMYNHYIYLQPCVLNAIKTFSISYPDLIKLPYFADREWRDRGWKEAQRLGEDRMTLRKTLTIIPKPRKKWKACISTDGYLISMNILPRQGGRSLPQWISFLEKRSNCLLSSGLVDCTLLVWILVAFVCLLNQRSTWSRISLCLLSSSSISVRATTIIVDSLRAIVLPSLTAHMLSVGLRPR